MESDNSAGMSLECYIMLPKTPLWAGCILHHYWLGQSTLPFFLTAYAEGHLEAKCWRRGLCELREACTWGKGKLSVPLALWKWILPPMTNPSELSNRIVPVCSPWWDWSPADIMIAASEPLKQGTRPCQCSDSWQTGTVIIHVYYFKPLCLW